MSKYEATICISVERRVVIVADTEIEAKEQLYKISISEEAKLNDLINTQMSDYYNVEIEDSYTDVSLIGD
jgi:hypothetical protein